MSEAFLPFALPDIGTEEISAVTEVLQSGWITTGRLTNKFEKAFVDFLGGGVEAIAVNSATSGLHLALESLGVGPDDEVILPTLTFTATAEVVRYLGADPVLVDIDPITLNIDIEKVRSAITSKTKVIMPVHYAGLACNMTEILAIARDYGLKIVEDAAHALPTTFKGTLVGQIDSDVTVFSFYANKTMTTGEGGMVITKNQSLAKRIRVMRLHGISRDAFDRFSSKKPSWFYEIIAPGFKYNLTDIASAIGIEQLSKLPAFLERRQQLAQRYFNGLSDLPLILPPSPPDADIHAWHLYVIRLAAVKPSMNRDFLIEELSKLGIGTSVHYVPLHRQPYWRDRYNLIPQMFPEAEKAYNSMLSIPLFTKMSDHDQDRVIHALHILLG